MVRADALSMIDDPSHAGAKEILSNADNVVRFLDQNGVDRVCCINYVAPDVMGFTRDVNAWIADFTRSHRDRLLPAGSVHPKYEADAGGETRRVLDLGLRMIKIHPPHTGTSVFPRARNVFADPMPVDDMAVDFPRLPIILSHAGRPLYGETAFFLARRHPNVYVDISGIPPKSLSRYVPRLADISDKVLWGTDWPAPGVTSLRKNIDEFRALGYGDAVEKKVLWENASRLFG